MCRVVAEDSVCPFIFKRLKLVVGSSVTCLLADSNPDERQTLDSFGVNEFSIAHPAGESCVHQKESCCCSAVS